jgi:hypothetical protein
MTKGFELLGEMLHIISTFELVKEVVLVHSSTASCFGME